MKTSSKIWMGLSGVALVALGIVCICNPLETLISASWALGLFTIVSGMCTIMFWSKIRFFLPSGNLVLEGILQIILGLLFMSNKFFLALALPVAFAFWLIVEGTLLAIRSFDFKAVYFRGWWLLLLLGICAAVLGAYSLSSPVEVAGPVLSTVIGIGIILVGVVDLVILCGINKLQSRRFTWIDEQ